MQVFTALGVSARIASGAPARIRIRRGFARLSRLSGLALLLGLTAFPLVKASGQVPGLLSYQGEVGVSGSLFEGAGQFGFALVSPDGTQVYWGNSPDNNHDGVPDNAVVIMVNQGLFSVLLGDTNLTNMAALPVSIFTNNSIHLRVWFNDGVHGIQQLSPDQTLGSAAYALMAGNVPDGAITAAKLAAATVTLINSNLAAQVAALTIGLDSLSNALNTASNQLQGSVAADMAAWTAQVGGLGSALAVSSNHLQNLVTADMSSWLSLSGALNTFSNQTQNAIILDEDGWAAQVGFLSGSLTTASNHLASSINTISNQSQGSIPSGLTAASANPQDPVLGAQGYQLFSSIAAPAWATSTAAGVPSARSAQASVWTGQELIVWGGTVVGGTDSGLGGRYRPDLDTWQAVSTVNAPAARSQHQAVWTGQEMIVWGGVASGAYLGTGGRFNPTNQIWTTVSSTGAPAGRDGHVAVWTGSRMVIWSGRNNTGLLADGFLYDPVADQWTALTLANAPVARFGASAVWTGSSILVWGGANEQGDLGTGAQLTFDTQGTPLAWVTINTSNAPSARSAHTAVWTGQKMMVWGGTSSGALLADGAAYDPVANSWSTINPTNAPTARDAHSAVWTGLAMVVFGGETGSGTAATGSAYDPVAGQWSALSNAGNPLARSGAAAVWTGSSMLVFAGLSNGQPLASLQSLNPQPTWYLYRKP